MAGVGAGHVSIATTQRYLPTVVTDLRTAMGGRNYRAGRTGNAVAAVTALAPDI